MKSRLTGREFLMVDVSAVGGSKWPSSAVSPMSEVET